MSSSTQTQIAPALKNILFATDFSACSQTALPFLRAIAVRCGSTVHVVHVIAPEARTPVPLDNLPELDVERINAESAMKVLMAADAFEGIVHTATVERGEVWEILESLVQEKSIDLVVLATHGWRGLKKLVLGSTAEQVFRLAPCPVLTVGPRTTNQDFAQACIGPILFATDFSSGSHHALTYAVSLARANHSRIILLHAVPPSVAVLPGSMEATFANKEAPAELVAEALACARGKLEELISSWKMQDVEPQLHVECGEAVDLILGVAESKHAELIVMGAHRASLHSVAAHLPWATATAVVREATCPVLTVRS